MVTLVGAMWAAGDADAPWAARPPFFFSPGQHAVGAPRSPQAAQQPSPLKSARSSASNLEAASVQAAQLVQGLLCETDATSGASRHGVAPAFRGSDACMGAASDSDVSRASSRASLQACRMSPGRASAASYADAGAAAEPPAGAHSGGAPAAAHSARRQLAIHDPPRTGPASISRPAAFGAVRGHAAAHGDVIEQLQAQHQQRLNEMAEASARIARQKETEIQHLTSTMQQALEKAAERETAALRRADKAEQEKAAMERDHKSDMLDLRAQLEHLHERLESRTSAERAELARRLQGAISNVKLAAERDIDQLNLQIDSLQQERDDLFKYKYRNTKDRN